jgi:hypothetical protein
MGTGWYYDLGRLLLVLRREEEGAVRWSCGRRSAGGRACCGPVRLWAEGGGRREEGKLRSVEGGGVSVGRSAGGLPRSAERRATS